ncbi:PIN-like domain-containing protein [Corynebacterium freiburgense]|uniref:PIN-like domain-containing protein n=1 Tax=Corynebacterium freiburgense TaxID=556548 RepID=UPI000416AB20|nr:PIN-like domain-containing protein [Corynebacterium freiburgense]WJZ03248.1 hypothetical protein CFREI_09855 [Corynebacterium freiburgense]
MNSEGLLDIKKTDFNDAFVGELVEEVGSNVGLVDSIEDLIKKVDSPGLSTSDWKRLCEKIKERKFKRCNIILSTDTNILKQLYYYQESNLKYLISNFLELPKNAEVSESTIITIFPGQAYVEFCNNYRAFSKESLNKYKVLFKKMVKECENFEKEIDELINIGFISRNDITNFKEKVDEWDGSIDQEYPIHENRPTDYWSQIFGNDLFVSFVPRSRFMEIAKSRFSCKIPPGWEDYKTKNEQGFGDFFCWLDLIGGVRSLDYSKKVDSCEENLDVVLFLSNDTKADWNMGEKIHPYLSAEFKSLTKFDIVKMTDKQFIKFVKQLQEYINEQRQNSLK